MGAWQLLPADGIIPHPIGTPMDIKFRDGRIDETYQLDKFDVLSGPFTHTGSVWDVIAFRLVTA